ncbi:MAG: ABC transporter permease [Gemmataceae bacterium]
MHAYLEAIWNCRFFWLSLVKMDLRSRYRGSVLGIGWSLVHPIAMTAILCVVFRVVFRQKLSTYAPLVFTGFTFWGFFGAAVVQGCGCFFQGESYIRQYPAPMAIYPLRNILGAAFHFSIGLLLAILIGLVYGPDTDLAPSATRVHQLLAMPSLLPSCLLLLLFGWSLSVLSGLLSVRFRDTRHLAEIALQGLFYLTPVMYRIETFQSKHRLTLLLRCNPLVSFLDLIRDPILLGRIPTLTTYAIAASVVLLLTLVAILALWFEERKLIFYL